MNSDQIEGKWKQLKGSFKQQWAKLTDDDLTAISGKKDVLVGRLQERYGYTREQAQREADAFSKANSGAFGDDLDDAKVHHAAARANSGKV